VDLSQKLGEHLSVACLAAPDFGSADRAPTLAARRACEHSSVPNCSSVFLGSSRLGGTIFRRDGPSRCERGPASDRGGTPDRGLSQWQRVIVKQKRSVPIGLLMAFPLQREFRTFFWISPSRPWVVLVTYSPAWNPAMASPQSAQ